MAKKLSPQTKPQMNIEQKDNGKKGSFYVEQNGELLAEMTYAWSGADKIIIDHTEVSEKLAGKGIGKQLVHKAVDFARERKIKIMPLCPFAKNVFDRVEAYQDVLF
jgi:predicted GNAT family acetyltransferase